MEGDRRDLAQHLFATALARLEDATEIARTAQVSPMFRLKLARCADQLQEAAEAIGILAAAAGLVAQAGRKK